MRYFRLDRCEGGTLPDGQPLRVGTVIRVPRLNSRRPGAVWNAAELAWVAPVWVECGDPREVRAP